MPRDRINALFDHLYQLLYGRRNFVGALYVQADADLFGNSTEIPTRNVACLLE